jgi:hypothetical protein
MGDGDDLDINNIQNEAATEYNPEAVTTEGQRRAAAAEAAARRARARIVYSASAFGRAGTEKKRSKSKKRKSSKSKKRKSSKSKKRKSSKSKKRKSSKSKKRKSKNWF